MAASSSGTSGRNASNAMEEETPATGESTAGTMMANCVEISFEEFLRRRSEESLQLSGFSGGASGGDSMLTGNVEVDESPLKPSINRNKESLKLKLQMRRPINQLVEQGILPSPNTPPAYACQRVKLERARMGDLLKAKIQQRPSRQELVRQHILEETDPRVAPLLAEKQRMLKRARLADSLNDHLIHRPGPLELVQKNILHAPDESIEKAIKEGIVPFKATCEGATPGPPLPTKYICQEDDSSSDVSSPSVNLDSVSAEENVPTPSAPPSAPDLSLPETVLEVQNKVLQAVATVTPVKIVEAVPIPTPPPPPPYSFTIPESTASTSQQNIGIFAVPIFGNASQSIQQQPIFQSTPSSISSTSSTPSSSNSSSFKSRSKKISKSKSQSKPKTIKFHEYRGPPSAQKSSTNISEQNKRPAESSYELLLQQQQLFLQWQLEWQHRFPKILLPAVSKMSAEEKKAFCSTLQSSTFPSSALSHHHNLHPVVSSSDKNCLPVSILSSNPTNSVLILSSTAEPSISTNNNNINNNNTHSVSYVQQPQQITPQPATTTAAVATTTTLVITSPLPQSSVNQNNSVMPAMTTSAVVKVENKSTNEVAKVPTTTIAATTTTTTSSTSSQSIKLNDWKVNELKAELKKRNLPVSGSKSQLVERLQAKIDKEKEKGSKGGQQTVKKIEEVKENGIDNNNVLTMSPSQDVKFFITNNNSTPTLLNSGTLEFLHKSGILKPRGEGKDTAGIISVTPNGVSPSSRSVLQQKIQQKMQQQQAKTQSELINKNESTPAVTVVNELRTWMPSCNGNAAPQSVEQQENVVDTSSTNPISGGGENSWVLKIRETPPPSASFENCLADLLSEATSQPTPTPLIVNQGSPLTQQQQQHVKSQMVDDVLEILIRHGELPPSAASTHHMHPSSSAQQRSDGGNNFQPPPAPPLPPTTFAVTLPTEISFRRLAQQQPFRDEKPMAVLERKGSLGINSLTKEAEEILKIGESNPIEPPSCTLNLNKDGGGEEYMDLDTAGLLNMELKSNKSSLLNGGGDSIVIDELLTEALEFPMDTEYSDWLESFSADNNFHQQFNNQLDKEDSRGDPLLSSTKSCETSNILDNNFPTHTPNCMDVDVNDGTEYVGKIKKSTNTLDEQNLNINVGDLWDFNF